MRTRHFASTAALVTCGLMSFSEPGAMALTDAQAQAQTVEDIRNVGGAMFSWLIDQVSFASQGPAQVTAASTIHIFEYPPISHSDLESLLVPQYMESVPALDGWGHPYDFYLNTADPLALAVMAIRSPGRDGAFAGDTYFAGPLNPLHFDEDVVWADGAFACWPQISLSDRQAQAQTVSDVNKVGAAMFSWLINQVGFAPGGASPAAAAATVDFSLYPSIAHLQLESLLVPRYIPAVPRVDGWGHPYDFRLNTANPLAPQGVAIRSPGRDGDFSGGSYLVGSFDSDHFDEDIAWADGSFARRPEPTTGLSFYTVPPCRVLDTRLASALPSGAAGLFHLGRECGISMSAKAVVVNVTVVGPTGAGHITLFPGGIPVPSASTISFAAGQVRANNAVLNLGSATASLGAWASVVNDGQVHLILDVNGYFE